LRVAGVEDCVVPACTRGKQRAADGLHCCWPNQDWSAAQNACTGAPQCPTGFAVAGEDCALLDRDRDGIPDDLDNCPDTAEDLNTFEDADGCPDEAKRLGAYAALERQRLEQQTAALGVQQAAAMAAERARMEAFVRQRDALKYEQSVASAHARRTAGIVVTGVGLLAGIGSFIFMGLGAAENGSIHGGSFATGSDIASAAASGSTDNAVAIVLGIVGLVGCGTGVPLFVSGLGTPEKPPARPAALSVTPMTRNPGVLATIHFE